MTIFVILEVPYMYIEGLDELDNKILNLIKDNARLCDNLYRTASI